jgi:hypothetical protein
LAVLTAEKKDQKRADLSESSLVERKAASKAGWRVVETVD